MNTATDIIRALRALGLSQSEIARRTGIPQPRISRWAAGTVPAGADDALRLRQLHQDLVEKADQPAAAVVDGGHA